MGLANNVRALSAVLCVIAATAVLLWFGNGLNACWPVMWIAPLPVLVLATRSSWRVAGRSAFLVWLLGCLSLWHYLVGVLHVPIVVWIVMFASQALLFALAILLFRALLLRSRPWAALLAFPSAWVSMEFVNNLLSPHGTGGSLSYTQLKFLPFLQLASITGPWGITFLLLLFPTAIAVGLHRYKSERKQAVLVFGSALGLIAVALVFGAVRLATGVVGSRVRVGLIASDRINGIAAKGEPSQQLFRTYAAQARELATQGAQVIVLPEKIGVVAESDVRGADSIFQSVANDTQVPLIVGMLRFTSDANYNQARIYLPGATPLTHNKQHMLPPFESDLKPGAALALLKEPSGTWGVAICKDMDFARPSLDYGRAGAGLMLVPAWDFVLDRAWHGHMAIMRGVENGFSVARGARQGFLTISDSRGRILAEKTSDSADVSTLLADVPVAHDRTIYLVMGDWFGWLAIAILGVVLAQFFRRPASRQAIASQPTHQQNT